LTIDAQNNGIEILSYIKTGQSKSGHCEPPIVENIDHTSPFDRLTKSAALVVTLFAVLFYFVFEYVVGPAKGRVASICAAMIVTTVWMRWDLRKRVWFWVMIAILILLHLPLVMLLPWTNNNYPSIVLLPVALLDLAIIYGIIKLAEKTMTRV
jgi:hypothetical protein